MCEFETSGMTAVTYSLAQSRDLVMYVNAIPQSGQQMSSFWLYQMPQDSESFYAQLP